MATMLEARAVSKAFGGIHALNECSITVETGKITGLIGPNGSGKTTLFNVMTGYEKIDSGEVRFESAAITNRSPESIFRMGVGRTFQLARIFPRLTVLENMHVAVQRKGVRNLLSRWSTVHEQREALDQLDFVGISRLKDMPAGNLSYGQKKLLELAFILIANPRLILLDEPAGGVNPTIIEEMAERIRILNRRGVTFLVVEHNMEFVMSICDRVTVLHRGTMIAEGPPDAVRSDPSVLEAYLGD